MTPQVLWLKQLLGQGCAGQQGEAQASSRQAGQWRCLHHHAVRLSRAGGGKAYSPDLSNSTGGGHSARSQCHLVATMPILRGLEGCWPKRGWCRVEGREAHSPIAPSSRRIPSPNFSRCRQPLGAWTVRGILRISRPCGRGPGMEPKEGRSEDQEVCTGPCNPE